MNKIIILLVSLLFPVCIQAQQVQLNELEKKGERYILKKSKKYFSGELVEYHTNKQMRSLVTVVEGKIAGKMTHWYANGNKAMEVKLINGKKIGWCKEWYENGQLAKEGHYVQGLEDGVFQWWYENGTKKRQGIFEQGDKVGNWEWFYENGQTKRAGMMVGNEMDGYWKEWYADGQLRMEGMYLNGYQIGEWKWWTQTGDLSYKQNYSVATAQNADIEHAPSFVKQQEALMDCANEGNYKGAIKAINQQIELAKQKKGEDELYRNLLLQKAQVHVQFINLNPAEKLLLAHLNIPVSLIDQWVNAISIAELAALETKIESLQQQKVQALGSSVLLSIIYNLTGDDTNAAYTQARALRQGNEAVWVDQWAVLLYNITATRLNGHKRLEQMISIRETRSLTKLEYWEIASLLLVVGAFEEADAICSDYMNEYGVQKEMLIVQMNRWMAEGDMSKMKAMKEKILAIDPNAL